MSAKQFDRIREVLRRQQEISGGEQAAHLNLESAGETDLRREVESLLGFDSADALPATPRTGGLSAPIPASSPEGPSGESLPKRMGPFEVLGELGRGGMGIVLRARDTRLAREVALKILPEAFAGHPERLARFSREAQLLAALNHPNIAHIYGLERLDGTSALVMELVEGESLAERIARGPLGLSEALGIARQVAEAVEAAHDRGIVHRDLKPANVMVGPRGRVKVLDFGLAKALNPENDETAGDDPERPGANYQSASVQEFILGTPAYMSPEQLRRQQVTRRADVWAFGCICFELLTGHPAFARDTLLDTAMAVLGADPDWSLLPEATPVPFRRLLRRCLHKDENERLRDLGDVRILLDDLAADLEGSAQVLPAAKPAPGARWFLVVAGILAAAFAAGLGLARWAPSAAREPIRVKDLTTSGHDNLPAVSPDGRRIALVSDRDGRSRIWIKELSTGAEQPITEGHDTLPQFSPDGVALLFVRTENNRWNVYRQALVAGHPLKVVDDALEACWSPKGDRIAFVRRKATGGGVLATVPAHGGPETPLYESNRPLYGARWSPRENEIVVVESPPSGSSQGYSLVFINPDSEGPANEARRVSVRGPISTPAWTGGGRRLLYAQAGSPLGDLGDPVSTVVLHDLDTDRVSPLFYPEWLFPTLGQWNLSRATALGVVESGSVVFGRSNVKQTLGEMPLANAPSRKPVPRGGRRDRQPAYSPDGDQLVFSSDRSGNLDIWLFDFRDGSLRQLTDDPAQDWDPAFTRDGRNILWSSNRKGHHGPHLEIWSMRIDGSGARQISNDGEDAENPTETADGAWILYWTENPAKSGIWRMRPDGTDAIRLVPGGYSLPETSPDGRWAAFLSQEPANLRTVIGVLDVSTGKVMPFQITVPWPSDRSERLILGRPRWLPGGREIAYVGVNDQGRSGIFVQEFDPNRNTDDTRQVFAGFTDDLAVESFGLSPDGRYAALSAIHSEQSIRIARNVPDVEPASGKESR